MTNITDLLTQHLSAIHAAPFLFVGSGLSRRYVGMETWKAMLERFAHPLAKDFGYYVSKADGDMPKLASLLAEEFHEVWWTSSEYQTNRSAFSEIVNKSSSPLKIEIAQYVKEYPLKPGDEKLAEELDLLKQGTIDGIITTNWDLLLENRFPDFEVFVGQDRLLFSHPQSIAEIYKIHGCCTEPNSLVLTQEDYADFNARNPYLAAKLLTIFIEHPVIFLGYSLSDSNIIGILNAITSCLKTDNLEALTDRLIFVQRASGGGDEFLPSSMSLDGKILPITLIKTDDFGKVYRAMGENKRKFPAKTLRRLKSHIYDLVQNNDSHCQMHVADLEGEDDASNLQVVYGVGVAAKLGQHGYRRIQAKELLQDVVFGGNTYNAEQIILHTLPDLLVSSKYVPVFKYLHEAGYLSKPKDSKNLPPRVQKAMVASKETFGPPKTYTKKKTEVRGLGVGVKGLASKYSREHCLLYIHFLDLARHGVAELESFLRDHFESLFGNTNHRTNLRKLVCLYDLLKYKPDL